MAGTSSDGNKMAKGETQAAMVNKKSNTKLENSIPMARASSCGKEKLCVGDAFVFAMLCVVGLPVEVQVKDGSVYSGIFHTADISSGLMLKKAKKITEGKRKTNIPLGSFVDTLVILSEDFVQVIVKDFTLPWGKSSFGNSTEAMKLEKINNNNNNNNNVLPPVENGSSKSSSKESKLNAGARAFSPAINKLRPVISSPVMFSPVVSSPVVNQYHVPNIKSIVAPPVIPNIGTYSIVPNRPSITEKPILYNNFTPANTRIPTPYPHHIMGCENMRVQQIGVINQYRPVQVAPNYITPNPSLVHAPRPSPIMYMRPIPNYINPHPSHGPIQGPALLSHPILNPYQNTLPKFQGPPAPMCVTPPLLVNTNRPIMVSSPVPFGQPFGPIRPIIMPNGSANFPTNFT